MKNNKKPFDPLSLPKLGFLGDRWPFILLAVIISVVVIMTSGLFGREEGSAQYTGVDEYNFVKGKVLTVDNSKLSEDPYIEGMMLGSQPITVEIMAGAHKGERFDVDNVMSRGFNISTKPGQVILLNVREENGVITGVDVFGYNRDYTLYILIGVFLAVLIFIGRKKGLYSSISLVIPTSPSVSWRADGVVIISIFSICAEGICSNACVPLKTLGFPSTYTANPLLPRKVTCPSASTRMEGVFSNISTAEPPLASRLLDASITFLSSL